MVKVSDSSRKIHRLIKRRWDHAREYWRPQNDMYGRLLAFCLDLEHYKTNEGFEKDKRRVQPRTQKQLNLIRHKASMLLRKMPEFDGHAVQPYASARAAEISRRVIENIFHDPLKGYHDVRTRLVWSALAGGRGNVAIDWHPTAGVVFRFVDPRRFHITPGCTFLHSPLTPFCVEEVPMRMSDLMRMKKAGWDIPSDITPDDWKPNYSSGSQRDDSLVDFRDGQTAYLPGADESEESDKIITVLKTWYREDPFDRPRKKERNADLPPEEWHFVDDGTGEQVPFDPMAPEPPISQVTGAPLRLVTRKSERYDPSDMEDGYLFITAPFYNGEKPLFEGGWAEGAINSRSTLSAFPYMELGCYNNPLRRQGMSDTEATRTLVVVDNASYRATFEQMKQTGGILVTEAGSLMDSEGNQFQFSDDPISIAYAKDRLSLEGVHFFQAPGMNSSMPAFRNMVGESWQSIGTGDFSSSLGPDRSKDIAASTIARLQESGDLPVQLHQQDLNQQESIAARVALDYCRAYMGDNVVSWVTDEGEAVYASVRGSDLVPLKISITAGREWRQQDIDRVQAQAQFLGMVMQMQLPPEAQTILLREAQFSSTVIDALAAALEQQKQEQQQMMQQQMMMQQQGGQAPGGELPPNGPDQQAQMGGPPPAGGM